MKPTSDVLVDTTGLVCPVPIIHLARAAKELGSGVIELIADDPATQYDVSAWCEMRSATQLATSVEQRGDTQVFRYSVQVGIQVGAEPSENAGGVASTSERLDK